MYRFCRSFDSGERCNADRAAIDGTWRSAHSLCGDFSSEQDCSRAEESAEVDCVVAASVAERASEMDPVWCPDSGLDSGTDSGTVSDSVVLSDSGAEDAGVEEAPAAGASAAGA